MRIPRLVWNRRYNVAALTVSYSRRIWHTREAGDFILGYNATGRLARIVILDPHRQLSDGADVRDAIVRVTAVLLRHGDVRQSDLDVLRSALERTGMAPSPRRVDEKEKGPDRRTLPLAPEPGRPSPLGPRPSPVRGEDAHHKTGLSSTSIPRSRRATDRL